MATAIRKLGKAQLSASNSRYGGALMWLVLSLACIPVAAAGLFDVASRGPTPNHLQDTATSVEQSSAEQSTTQQSTTQQSTTQQSTTQQSTTQRNTAQQSTAVSNPAGQLTSAPAALDAKQIAKVLFAATVTVQVTYDTTADEVDSANDAGGESGGTQIDNAQIENAQSDATATNTAEGIARDANSGGQVTIGTGVSLGDGLIITFSDAPASAEYRVTLPSGEQTPAALRVLDHYSGLRLLEIGAKDLPRLPVANALPEPGDAILSASAAGIEPPVLGLGMLSATDRSLSGTGLPPLLQCVLPNTDTTAGAAVVNGDGEMIGAVAVSASGNGNDWTFVVPVAHAMRLKTAFVETDEDDRNSGKVVVLSRLRPHVGMTLEVGENHGEVVVDRVDENGPAHKAGLRPGMQVLSCEGIKVESVYAVVGTVLKKQPGDHLRLVVRDGERERTVSIALDGGELVEPADIVAATGVHSRNLRVGENNYQVVRPLAVGGAAPVPSELQQIMELVELLNRQKTMFAGYIEQLRQENEALRKKNAELQQRIDDR